MSNHGWNSRKNSRHLDFFAKSDMGSSDELTMNVLLFFISPNPAIQKFLLTRKSENNARNLFRHAQMVIADALYRYYEYGADGSLIVSRDTSRKAWPKRYRPHGISHSMTIATVDALIDSGLLEASRPGMRQPMFFRATNLLIHLSEVCKFDIYKHFSRQPTEVIFVKRWRKPKGKPRCHELVDYDECDISYTSRRTVEEWAQYLAEVGVTQPNGNLMPKQAFTKLKRLFRMRGKKAPFQSYGRFHAPWQQYPEKNRLSMKIGGKDCCEIDIRGSIIQTAYALACKRQCPMPDPYQTPLVLAHPELRMSMKAAALRIFSIKQGFSGACNSLLHGLLRDHPYQIETMERLGISVTSICNDFVQTHKDAIGEFFFSFRELELMFWESQVTLEVIANLTSNKIPVLTTHDSYLCRLEDEEQVKVSIMRAFETILGATIVNESWLLKTSFGNSGFYKDCFKQAA